MSLLDFDADQLATFAAEVRQDYDELKAKDLKLDLTRGKPAAEQLDLADALLELPGKGNHHAADGTDVRNYGNLTGLADIRGIWAELLGVELEQIYAGDSSSLNIMFDLVSWAYAFGTNDSDRPWKDEETVKWICPVPGYDRHFTITEKFGFEMISVPMLEDGPDLGAIQELVKDPQVKGMWLVPVFSNPTGITTSEEIARGLAEMETAAPDFRIVWDNAYAVHTLTDEFPPVHDVLGFAEAAGHPNRFWYLTSTSKITHAGAGVSFFASSPANLDWYKSVASARGIGPNKVNQRPTPATSATPRACARSCAATPTSWRRNSPRCWRSSKSAWASTRSPAGRRRRADTSSPSTSSTAPPRAWWSWPKTPASP